MTTEEAEDTEDPTVDPIRSAVLCPPLPQRSFSFWHTRASGVYARAMRRPAVAVLCAIALPLGAQVPAPRGADSLRSSITGMVRDSLGFPVVGATVMISPGGFILRTDSSGRFDARGTPVGNVAVRVRRLDSPMPRGGPRLYRAEWHALPDDTRHGPGVHAPRSTRHQAECEHRTCHAHPSPRHLASLWMAAQAAA